MGLMAVTNPTLMNHSGNTPGQGTSASAASKPGPASQLGPLARPGPEEAVEIVTKNVLRFFCGLSEAAEDNRCNGCPIKSVSERRSDSSREEQNV